MAQKIIQRAPDKSDIYCYDNITNADEVNVTLHEIVKQFQTKKNIWVVSGTHGNTNGTVTGDCKEQDFKKEDLSSADVTSKNIFIKNYHGLAPNNWKELSGKAGSTNIIVLAFCFSYQWFNNETSADGNNGRL
jgi:hypothetical protein